MTTSRGHPSVGELEPFDERDTLGSTRAASTPLSTPKAGKTRLMRLLAGRPKEMLLRPR